MAKQTKNTEAEKPVKKTTKKKENIVEEQNITEAVDATEVGVDMAKIEEAVNNIDTTINTDNIEAEIKEKVNESVAEISELAEKMNEFEKSKEVLGKELKDNEKNAMEIIEKEIEKTIALKQEVKKRISSNSGSVTGWWNGMGYDF